MTPHSTAWCSRIERARHDVNAFVELVGEGPGRRPLHQDPIHLAWQRLWTDHDRSVLWAPVGTGKTSQVRLRLLWELGRDPNLQIAFVGATNRHPLRVFRALRSDIEQSARLHEVFPHLRPGKLWTDLEFQVERSSREPDATMAAFGLFGSILGSRADLVVLDDVCNFENTLTEDQRDKAGDWLAEVLSRLRPDARVLCVGHVWHEQDVLHRLGALDGWVTRRDEAVITEDDAEGRSTRRPLAPSVMSLANIDRKERELGPRFAELMLYNRLVSEGAGRFRQSWFDGALNRGRGLAFADQWNPSTAPTFTGVDLGHRKKRGADLTVMVTAAVYPEGTRRILEIRSGRWSAPEIVSQLQDVHRRFGSIIAIESNGAQQMLLDFASELDCMPLRSHTTGATNKHDLAFGVESLGLQVANGKWIFPDGGDDGVPSEIAALIREALSYDPQRHSGDRLMAWWICAESIRKSFGVDAVPAECWWPDIDDVLAVPIRERRHIGHGDMLFR